jgi:hypothetical protein
MIVLLLGYALKLSAIKDQSLLLMDVYQNFQRKRSFHLNALNFNQFMQ